MGPGTVMGCGRRASVTDEIGSFPKEDSWLSRPIQMVGMNIEVRGQRTDACGGW